MEGASASEEEEEEEMCALSVSLGGGPKMRRRKKQNVRNEGDGDEDKGVRAEMFELHHHEVTNKTNDLNLNSSAARGAMQRGVHVSQGATSSISLTK